MVPASRGLWGELGDAQCKVPPQSADGSRRCFSFWLLILHGATLSRKSLVSLFRKKHVAD